MKLARPRRVVNPAFSRALAPAYPPGDSGPGSTGDSERGGATDQAKGGRRPHGRVETALGAAALAASTALAAAGVQPVRDWYFQFAWVPTLLLLDGGLALRTGSAPLAARPRLALSVWFWSGPTWYLFELLNLRMTDWYYVFVPERAALRWPGTFIAFATVLPAILLAHHWMDQLGVARGWGRPPFRVGRRHYAVCLTLGAAFVVLALAWPLAFFPLVWGASTLLLEPFNHSRDPSTSLLGDLARGSWTRIVRLLAGGAGIGLLWEGFNRLAGARWIYTVPGLEHLKLFEMPLPGFLGFPVFALDCFVIYHALVHLDVALPGWSGTVPGSGARGEKRIPLRPARVAFAAALALLFCAAVQVGLDRWTVDSVAPRLERLPGLEAGDPALLRSAGLGSVRGLAAVDSDVVAARAGVTPARAGALVRAARLAALRGIGTRNASALWRGGIRSVCDLAAASRERVSALVRTRPAGGTPGGAPRIGARAGKPARVRVWLRAATERCAAALGSRVDAARGPEGRAEDGRDTERERKDGGR